MVTILNNLSDCVWLCSMPQSRNFSNAMRLFVFICGFLFVTCDPIRHHDGGNRNDDVYAVGAGDNISTCPNTVAKMWSYDFHSCFIDRKYNDGGRDLNTIVDRILEHSNDCVRNSDKNCRPDYSGFMVIMDKVIYEIKDYCYIYLEHITHDRKNVKDLDCVENTLSQETYKNCFKKIFDEDYSTKVFEREVENAISCTNKANKQCSKAAKTSLNRAVRSVLRVKQPAKEDIEDDPKPPKRWYDYIIEPFVAAWKAIKSFFGF